MAGRTEREIDGLFTLPLEEFTAARNALARRLKQDGDAEAAEHVRALAKPTVPVWTINQLARNDPGAVRSLLAAGAELRKAQERALAGRGGSDALRSAQAKQREAVRDLGDRARTVLDSSSHPATPAVLERVARTLEAAALDEESRPLLKAGRLAAELEPGGFDSLAGFGIPTGRAAPAAGDELAERRRQKEEARRRKRELQEKVRDLERRATEAEREAERAERTASEAREAADEARDAADAAAAELDDLS
jgi:predicted ribosome quality control (RQC) complex YloA/Tae2 family protein